MINFLSARVNPFFVNKDNLQCFSEIKVIIHIKQISFELYGIQLKVKPLLY